MPDPTQGFQLAPLIKDIFAIDGFSINESKCKITGAGLIVHPNNTRHGTTALGIPIGNKQFRTATTRSKIAVMGPPLAPRRSPLAARRSPLSASCPPALQSSCFCSASCSEQPPSSTS